MLDPETGACLESYLREEGVTVLSGSPVKSMAADAEGVTLVAGEHEVRADAAVVAIGVEPAVELAREAGVKLGPTGAIEVDEHLATSVEHISAAGDCVEVRHAVSGAPAWLPLGSLANRQGRVLANVLAGRADSFPPVAGAMAVKLLDWNVAAVGLTCQQARRRGLEARAAWLSGEERAHYWPESVVIHLELVYEVGTRRLLGLQAVGRGDCTKRVDVATQHLTRGARLDDLAHVEHAYAPPYAPAMEPLAVLAQVALNQEEDVTAEEPVLTWKDEAVLDVRQPDEVESLPVQAEPVTTIPLGELRRRLPELESGSWLVVCERGTRSAEAVRLLRHAGAKARYVGGGLLWVRAAGGGGS
jgi:rhodanese-related sulfurtransferase